MSLPRITRMEPSNDGYRPDEPSTKKLPQVTNNEKAWPRSIGHSEVVQGAPVMGATGFSSMGAIV